MYRRCCTGGYGIIGVQRQFNASPYNPSTEPHGTVLNNITQFKRI
jgi:hypothetical protein